MELPISPQSYQPGVAALVRAIKRGRLILGRTMAREVAVPGATLLLDPDRPFVRSANFACELNLSSDRDPAALLSDISRTFQEAGCRCHVLDTAESDWPNELAQAAGGAGYEPIEKKVLQLTHHQPGEPVGDVQIVPARAVYRELPAFYQAMAMTDHHADQEQAEQFARAMIDRLDEPRMDLFAARKDHGVAAVAGVLSLGQMGVIDAAYTLPAYRGRGLAGALLRRVLDHCQRALFEQVLLERSAACPSVGFYQSRGFVEVAAYHRYRHPHPAKPKPS